MICDCFCDRGVTYPACREAEGARSLAMVYISSWQEFQEAAEGLYEKSPNKVRKPMLWICYVVESYQ